LKAPFLAFLGRLLLMIILRALDAETSFIYGCDLRRLFPWPGVADPLWGSAIASVRPGESTTEHGHDEEETFLILSGSGTISVDGEVRPIGRGDLIYLPRHSRHFVANGSSDAPLEFLSIFWGSPEANARMAEMIAENAQAA
jgi:oxalate decarboxylase/phosphoglucose isomerase-like protein (cupin superfamily)